MKFKIIYDIDKVGYIVAFVTTTDCIVQVGKTLVAMAIADVTVA